MPGEVGVISTNTYITANSLSSNATFYNMTFNNSRSSGTFRYNILVSGTDTNLNWWLYNYGGPRAGKSQDYDPDNKVHWWFGNQSCDSVASAQTGYWSVPGTWNEGICADELQSRNGYGRNDGDGGHLQRDGEHDDDQRRPAVQPREQQYLDDCRRQHHGQRGRDAGSGDLDESDQCLQRNAHIGLRRGRRAVRSDACQQRRQFPGLRGRPKTPSTLSTDSPTLGPGAVTVDVVDATGWQNGDLVTVDTETVILSGMPGTSFSATLSMTHYSSNTIRVSNLTRNVLVRSSGTVTGAGGNSCISAEPCSECDELQRELRRIRLLG